MTRRNCCLALLLAVTVLVPCLAQRSADVAQRDGMIVVSVDTPKGTVSTWLPDDLAAGDTVVGTVVATPSGSDELTGYVVEVGNQRHPVKERRGRWTLPEKVGAGVVFLRVLDAAGGDVGHVRLACQPHAPAQPAAIRLPTTGVAHQPLTIQAPLQGHMDDFTVRIGDQPADVIAASPRKCVVRNATIEGRTNVELRAGKLESRGELTNAPVTPALYVLRPAEGRPGDAVTLEGADFGADASSRKVRFGTAEAKVTSGREDVVQVVVPDANLSVCPVTVEVNGRPSNPVSFTYRVQVKLAVGKNPLRVGERTRGVFTVLHTEKRVEIHFKNANPDIVSFEGGDEQTVVTSGGADNQYAFDIVGKSGNRLYGVDFTWKYAP